MKIHNTNHPHSQISWLMKFEVLYLKFTLLRNGKMRPYLLKKDNARPGISLLLVMSLLGGLTLVTIAASDMVLTVYRSSRAIGDSEIAYLAAETAVERALLSFEKNGASLGSLNTGNMPMRGSAATYTTSAIEETIKPSNDARLTANNPTSPISSSNPLTISLAQGKSLYFDFGINGATYPNDIQIDFTNGRNASATIYASHAQSTTDYAGTGNSKVTIPNLGFTNGTRVKIQNTDAGIAANLVTLKPTGGDLPLGVVIVGTGRYRGVERRIEVFRPLYVIY